jgi:hypothetical protein
MEALEEATYQVARQHGWMSPEYEAAMARLVDTERAAAIGRGDEYAVEIDLGVDWSAGAPLPTLVYRSGDMILMLLSHFDDEDERLVVLEWVDCRGTSFGGPNDEGIERHRLWRSGLRGCLRSAEVHNSRWIATEENRVHPDTLADLRHYILLLKDETIEVLARDVRLHRHPGPWPVAAQAFLD